MTAFGNTDSNVVDSGCGSDMIGRPYLTDEEKQCVYKTEPVVLVTPVGRHKEDNAVDLQFPALRTAFSPLVLPKTPPALSWACDARNKAIPFIGKTGGKGLNHDLRTSWMEAKFLWKCRDVCQCYRDSVSLCLCTVQRMLRGQKGQ